MNPVSAVIGASVVKRTIQEIDAKLTTRTRDKIIITIYFEHLERATGQWFIYLLDHLGKGKTEKGYPISQHKVALPANNKTYFIPGDKFYMSYEKGPFMLLSPITENKVDILGYHFEFDINALKGKLPENIIKNIIFKRTWVYGAPERPDHFFPPQKPIGFRLRIPASRQPSKYISFIWRWCKSGEGMIVIGAVLISKWAANAALNCRLIDYNFWNTVSSGIAAGALAGFVVANTIKWAANKLDANQWYILGNIVRIGGIAAGIGGVGLGTAMTLGVIPGGTLLGAVLISAGAITTVSVGDEYIQKKKLCDLSCI